MTAKQILFPPARMVGGSVYKSNPVTDSFGKPKLKADGSPRLSWSFAVAYPKAGPGARWEQTAWGVLIKQAAVEGYPNGETGSPSFAWKIVDGDSTVPNKKGNKPCDSEGFPGHHVVWFSSEAMAPRLTDKMGTQEGTFTYADGVERIKPGHLIQVLANARDNAPSPSPGVYINYEMVAHNDATTPEIALRQAVDSTAVGFGGAAAAAPAAYVAPAAPPAQAVTPSTTFLAPPPPGAAAPAPPAAHVMLPAAGATTYEAYRAAGWTDEQMRQQGVMA